MPRQLLDAAKPLSDEMLEPPYRHMFLYTFYQLLESFDSFPVTRTLKRRREHEEYRAEELNAQYGQCPVPKGKLQSNTGIPWGVYCIDVHVYMEDMICFYLGKRQHSYRN